MKVGENGSERVVLLPKVTQPFPAELYLESVLLSLRTRNPDGQGHSPSDCAGVGRGVRPALGPAPAQSACILSLGRGHLAACLEGAAQPQGKAGGQDHRARLTQRGGGLGKWAALAKAKLGLFLSLSRAERLREFS